MVMFLPSCGITTQTGTQIQQQPTSTTVAPIATKVIKVASGESIQEVINLANDGDTVMVFGGDYDERLEIEKTLSIEAVGEVSMRGFVIQADEVTIRGFTIINLRETGINVKSGNNGVIEYNKFLYNGLAGLRLYNDTKGWIVRNNLFHRNNLYGAEVKGQNHLIEGNEVTHSIQHHPCVPTVNGADADGFRFHGSGHVFRNNFIHDMPDGREGYDKTVCSIEELANLDNDYDDSSHKDCFQTYGGSISFPIGHDTLFEGNVCELPLAFEWTNWASKAFQGSDGAYNLTFRNNLVVADFLSLFRDGCQNIVFEHNTFIGSNSTNSAGLKFIDCGDNAGSVKNNIFFGQRTSVGHLMVQNSTVEAGYNCVYIPDREPFRPPDPGDIWGVDPRLDADYHLLPGSPCIGVAEDGSDLGAFPYVVPLKREIQKNNN
jgi:parallel beta-helix repeat protein